MCFILKFVLSHLQVITVFIGKYSSMGEPTPTSVYWKDDNVKDEGAPDPRTVQFRPGRKPGIHLGRLSRYYLF